MISRDVNPPESLVGKKVTDGRAVFTVDGHSSNRSPGGGLFRVTHVSGPREFPSDIPLYANYEWFYSAEGPELVGD